MATGGATRVILNLVNNLDREEFDINLVVFNNKGELLPKVKEHIKIYNLNSQRVMLGTKKLTALLIGEKPKVVFTGITHVNLAVAILIPVLKVFLKNTIFITREVNIPSIRAKYLEKSKRMDYIYKRVISRFDLIIAQSKYMKQDIASSYKLNDKKILVVNNPIDIEYINREINREKDINIYPNNKINIVAVGMLRKQKGFEKLIHVFKILDKKYHLHIIGDGQERKTLEKKILDLNLKDKVTLHGLKKNPYIYMKKADLVVLSSLYEGFPNVILEANVCGKFVVANRCAGVDEEIIIDGINGTLVENNNYEKFAKAIEKYTSKKIDSEKVIDTTKKYNVKNIVNIYRNIFLGEKQ
jgi:glycosyltransferase involved in cell wall biosynthesis